MLGGPVIQQRSLEEYIPFVGEEVVEEVLLLARHLQGARIKHINSTFQGGGVAELLNCLVPLMNEVGLEAEWQVMEAPDEFFGVTKRFHNALHGVPEEITPEMLDIYNKVSLENANKLSLDADFVVVHDPQPLGLAMFRDTERAKWIWRCHIDVAQADLRAWAFLTPFIDRFDAAVFHIPQFLRPDLLIPQYTIPPFIDPLSGKNRDLQDAEIQGILERHHISREQPFILQVSRYDRLKDPVGALRAYQMVKRSTDVGFVFLGNFAPDDPEGREVSEEVLEAAYRSRDTTIIVNAEENDLTVNALQRAAKVVLQKSIREGFGLVVTEAMWKAKPVVGGDTGGIAFQISDGVNGFLVQTVEGAAYRLNHLLSNPLLAQTMGQEARRRVNGAFLPPHCLRNWLSMLLWVRNSGTGTSILSGSMSA
jgi:trehalose synthase